MAGKGMQGLSEAMKTLTLSATRPLSKCSTQVAARRFMATEAPLSDITRSVAPATGLITHVPLTVHSFPSMEPVSLESWSAKHLNLPLRRDLLHLAVIFEGDSTRQGTGSSKTRWEVAGSHRKLYAQKGTGRARRGDKQSPLLRGGGKSFGPKPRDFSTRLNRKVYDLAWRTALSYRYRRGELLVTDGDMELPLPEDFLQLAAAGRLARELEDGFVRKYVKQMMEALRWGKPHGRTTFVTKKRRPNLFTSLELAGEDGRALELEDVDVKDLLETGRIVIERDALRKMIMMHQSDVVSDVVTNGLRKGKLPVGQVLLP